MPTSTLYHVHEMRLHRNKRDVSCIDICKTGSTCIRAALKHYGGKGKHHFILNKVTLPIHRRRVDLPIHKVAPLAVIPNDGSWKFTFVRNPWDRMTSYYRFCMDRRDRGLNPSCNADRQYHNMTPTMPWLTKPDFDEFVMCINEELTNTDPDAYPPVWIEVIPQWDWIHDDDGNDCMDFIGRFETIDDDWLHVRDFLSIEDNLYPTKITRTMEQMDDPFAYREYYTLDSRAAIISMYHDDILRFGYNF